MNQSTKIKIWINLKKKKRSNRSRNLRSKGLDLDLKSPGGEFDPDRGLGLEAELVPGESRQDVGFSDPRVADQHDLEQVIVFVIHSMRHLKSQPLLRSKKFKSTANSINKTHRIDQEQPNRKVSKRVTWRQIRSRLSMNSMRDWNFWDWEVEILNEERERVTDEKAF